MKPRHQQKPIFENIALNQQGIISHPVNSRIATLRRLKAINQRAAPLSMQTIHEEEDETQRIDIPKNDGAQIESLIYFFPRAAFCASTVSVTSLIALLLLAQSPLHAVAVSTASGAITLYGMYKYKSAQVQAKINQIKTECAEDFEFAYGRRR